MLDIYVARQAKPLIQYVLYYGWIVAFTACCAGKADAHVANPHLSLFLSKTEKATVDQIAEEDLRTFLVLDQRTSPRGATSDISAWIPTQKVDWYVGNAPTSFINHACDGGVFIREATTKQVPVPEEYSIRISGYERPVTFLGVSLFWGIWTIIICGSIFVAISWLLYYVFVRRQIEQTRRRIADDLHDDIGSKLSSITLCLDALSRKDELAKDDRHQLENSLDTARQLTRDLRDTVWLVDAHNDHLAQLVERMQETARQHLREHRLTLTTPESCPKTPLRMEVRRNIFLMYKEVLHNIVQHAQASHVSVEVNCSGDMFTVHVTDDGQGFNICNVQAGRGLKTLKKRAEQIDGKLTLSSTEGRGTSVQFSAPIKKFMMPKLDRR